MVRLPPPIWALAFVLISTAISYLAGWPGLPGLRIVWLAVVLLALGIASAVSAARLFRREGTEINPTSTTNARLVTSGPFRLTRNPMYLGLVLVASGIAFAVGAWPMFLAPLATFTTANWVHIPFEEAKMRRQFGAGFDDYCAKVRRWI
jgi:protein-S-isoprenylcysteine O-methyltransferase Ste14